MTRCPNLARHVFLHPDARTVYPDWVAAADEQVSRLRAATDRWGDDDDFAALMDELRTAPDFTERWSIFATTEKRRGTTHTRAPRPRRDCASTTRCSSCPTMSTSNGSSPGYPPTMPPPPHSPARATRAAPTSPAQLRVIG